MKCQVRLETDSFVILLNEKKIEAIPAFIFVGYDDRCVFGIPALRAVELFPQHVYSLSRAIVEKNKIIVSKILSEMNQYVIDHYKVRNYGIVLDIYPDKSLLDCMKKILHDKNISIKRLQNEYVMQSGVTLLMNDGKRQLIGDSGIVSHFNEVVAGKLAGFILRQFKQFTGDNYGKLKEVLIRNIEKYKEELILRGVTELNLKIVDQNYIVHNFECIVEEKDIISPDIQHICSIIDEKNEIYLRLKLEYLLHEQRDKVALISPFSHGKSTILNAILGDDILKTDIRAETAVITRVSDSEQKSVYVKYEDSSIEKFDYTDIKQIKEIIKNKTSVRSEPSLNTAKRAIVPVEIHILLSLKRLKDITLVDSPGLFSPHKHHNEIADTAFRQSDMILFIVNPGKLGERNFTEKLKEYLVHLKCENKKFCFVLNKCDIYKQEEETIFDEFDKVLESLNQNSAKVFFISGYFALIGRMLKNHKVELETVRKRHDIYVMEGDEIIAGRAIMHHHSNDLITFSNLEKLEEFIRERGNI